MLSSPTSLRRRLMAPIPITKRAKPLNRPAVFERLFQSLDRCLTLSATFNAIDSVLCSAFFDPNIPCNLLGAKRLAIKHALRLERKTIDYGKLLNAISAIAPHLAILWRGAICSGLAPSLFQQGNSDAPGPMSVAAFWTGKLHSFVQVTYQSSKPDASSLIPRSYEFSLTFFCRPKVRAPFPTAPPFGWTTVSNLSLELHEHYGHAHKPLWWRCNWHTHPGTLVPMSSKHHVTKVVCSMPEFSTSQGSQLM